MDPLLVLNEEGVVVDQATVPTTVTQELALDMYATMVKLQAMDNVFYDAQRQGRMSFYMTSYGEEAMHIGSAAALKHGTRRDRSHACCFHHCF